LVWRLAGDEQEVGGTDGNCRHTEDRQYEPSDRISAHDSFSFLSEALERVFLSRLLLESAGGNDLAKPQARQGGVVG
jgi:hypothetical protein